MSDENKVIISSITIFLSLIIAAVALMDIRNINTITPATTDARSLGATSTTTSDKFMYIEGDTSLANKYDKNYHEILGQILQKIYNQSGHLERHAELSRQPKFASNTAEFEIKLIPSRIRFAVTIVDNSPQAINVSVKEVK